MMELPRPGLEDPRQAAFAWARYRRLMRWMVAVAVLAIIAALWALDRGYGPLNWVTILATMAGVGGSVLMAAALMGLVFLSSGTGHDARVDDRD